MALQKPPPSADRQIERLIELAEWNADDALHQLARTTGAEERIIEGADHFFFGKLYPLGEAIRAWVTGAPPAR